MKFLAVVGTFDLIILAGYLVLRNLDMPNNNIKTFLLDLSHYTYHNLF